MRCDSRPNCEHWVRRLPKPVGVFACTDIYGQQVLTAARENDCAVPEEVAVLGVDNDAVFCDLATPSLSSVATDLEKVGYLAAQYLDQMMAGNTPPPRTLVEPMRVIGRRSTDTIAVEDPDMAAALRFIREHAAKGIRVTDVAAAAAVSSPDLGTVLSGTHRPLAQRRNPARKHPGRTAAAPRHRSVIGDYRPDDGVQSSRIPERFLSPADRPAAEPISPGLPFACKSRGAIMRKLCGCHIASATQHRSLPRGLSAGLPALVPHPGTPSLPDPPSYDRCRPDGTTAQSGGWPGWGSIGPCCRNCVRRHGSCATIRSP